MAKILPYYHVNERTMALLPVKHNNKWTTILEVNNIYHIHEKQLQIIKQACIDNYATYKGRKNAITFKTGYKRKVPIPINPDRGIYAFPTHALDDEACCWIFYHHVSRIEEGNWKAIVTFKNGMKIEVETSTYVLKTQMRRTRDCIYEYGGKSFSYIMRENGKNEKIADQKIIYKE